MKLPQQPNGEQAQLSETLIENALALTGKTMEDMNELTPEDYPKVFSIEKFCYYLLSPEFIEKYHTRYTDYPYWDDSKDITYSRFWVAIWKYQKGNHSPLISLLEKIWK